MRLSKKWSMGKAYQIPTLSPTAWTLVETLVLTQNHKTKDDNNNEKDTDTDKVKDNEQLESKPHTSGVLTKTRARKATDLPDVLVPRAEARVGQKKL